MHPACRLQNAAAGNLFRQPQDGKGRHIAPYRALDRARRHRRHRQHRRRGTGHFARRRGQRVLDVGMRTGDGRHQIRRGIHRGGTAAKGRRRLRRRHDVLSGRRGTPRNGGFLFALLHPRRVRRREPRAVQRHRRRTRRRGRKAVIQRRAAGAAARSGHLRRTQPHRFGQRGTGAAVFGAVYPGDAVHHPPERGNVPRSRPPHFYRSVRLPGGRRRLLGLSAVLGAAYRRVEGYFFQRSRNGLLADRPRRRRGNDALPSGALGRGGDCH